MRGISVDGAKCSGPPYPSILGPLEPINPMVLSPIFFAVDIARITFGDCHSSKYQRPHHRDNKASSCRENTRSKPWSFPIAVIHDVFTFSARAGRAGRSNANRPTNSRQCAVRPRRCRRYRTKPACCLFGASTKSSLIFATTDRTSALLRRSFFTAIDAWIERLTRFSKSSILVIQSPPRRRFRMTPQSLNKKTAEAPERAHSPLVCLYR